MLEFILSFLFLSLVLVSGQIYYYRREKNKTQTNHENDKETKWTEYTSKGKTTYTLNNNRVFKKTEKKRYKPKK